MFYLTWNPKVPKFLRNAGFRVYYRKQLSGGVFLLACIWHLIRLLLLAECWMIFGVFWLVWWMAKDLVLAVIWSVRVIVRLLSRETPIFPPFLPDDEA